MHQLFSTHRGASAWGSGGRARRGAAPAIAAVPTTGSGARAGIRPGVGPEINDSGHAIEQGIGLTRPQRQVLETELIRRGIGDALERRVFLAALDYQVAALLERLQEVAPALVTAACVAAMQGRRASARPTGDPRSDLGGDLGGDLGHDLGGDRAGHPGSDATEALCQSFVGELALAFDACFETAPTADAGGPFCGILDGLRRVTGLHLPQDQARIDQAIAIAGMC